MPAPKASYAAVPATYRILLIDDNVDAGDAMAALLQMLGHDIRKALDGPTGLKLAEEFQPHIVLSDIGLPGMDGYEVIRRLRAERSRSGRAQPFIVAVSGYGMAEDVSRARQAGFDRHLVKPIDPDELIGFIEEFAKRASTAATLH